MIQYITCPGDTFYKIINKYNTSYASLTSTNELKQLKWLKGQRLLLPTTDGTSIRLTDHVISIDETLDDIIAQYQITEEELRYFNNLTDLILQDKQLISIENNDVKKDYFEK